MDAISLQNGPHVICRLANKAYDGTSGTLLADKQAVIAATGFGVPLVRVLLPYVALNPPPRK